jgi:hypothetical protein
VWVDDTDISAFPLCSVWNHNVTCTCVRKVEHVTLHDF